MNTSMILRGALSLVYLAIGYSCFSQQQKPQYIIPSDLNTQVKPGDDFYQYSNGTWLAQNKANRSTEDIEEKIGLPDNPVLIKKIIDQAVSENKTEIQQNLHKFFNSTKGQKNSKKIALTLYQNDLKRIEDLRDTKNVIRKAVQLQKENIAQPLFRFELFLIAGAKNQYVPALYPAIANAQKTSNMRNRNSQRPSGQSYSEEQIAEMFQYSGNSAKIARNKATTVKKIEQQLLSIEDSDAELQKMSLQELRKSSPNLDWDGILHGLAIPEQETIWLSGPTYFDKLSNVIANNSTAEWKTYLEWQILQNSYLISLFKGDLEDSNTASYSLTHFFIKDLVQQLYFDEYYTARMESMLKNIQIAFEENIKKLDWMSAETKLSAINKMANLPHLIYYPFVNKKFEGLSFDSKDLVANIASYRTYAYNEKTLALSDPKKMPTLSNHGPNGFYDGKRVMIFGGLLAPPFYHPEADDAINYGTIGGIIAHEITHMLDPRRKIEKSIYTAEDEKAFNKHAEELIKQHNGYFAIDTVRLDGKLTISETTADLGGLTIAHKAFSLTKQGQSDEKIDGFTPDQRLFLAWAKIWRNSYIPQSVASFKPDPHPPGPIRIIGPVVNIDAWYEAFDVKPGDKMYIAPEKRVKMWE